MGYWLLHQKISVSHIDLYQNSESYKELKMAAIVTSLDDYRVKNKVRKNNTVAEIESGYTRVANELLESLASSDLTARQLKVMLAIVRKTYGFGKKFDRISDSQIAEITCLSRQNVNKAKNELITMRYLILEDNKIGVNKTVSDWINQSRDSVSNLKTKNVSKLETDGVSRLETHKRNLLKKKENTPLTPHEGDDEKLISNNRKNKIPYQEILQVYNETVGDKLPNAESLNDKRKRAIGKFWKELKNPSIDAARNYFEVFVETANPWYFGENDRGWRASFDYLLRPDTVTKTREGAL
ncbi:replication protein [Arsenophonus endosymbiont of Bemisia tabaci]|uniref:replication protein n=1 Tax=Arsenophonus endosymbiont of Bemisia tabaci TaxID=536059 RepID=UPI001EE18400|nr:replication protein [Arsenophonus endosymbiont of Bemisia tabaci]